MYRYRYIVYRTQYIQYISVLSTLKRTYHIHKSTVSVYKKREYREVKVHCVRTRTQKRLVNFVKLNILKKALRYIYQNIE